MTNIVFDLVDVVGEVNPGDTVRIWPPRVTRNADGQAVVTRPENIDVSAGPVTRDISPGPLWVQIQAGGYIDTDPKLVRVPEPGEIPAPITIADLLRRVEHYDPVLESWAWENAQVAEQAALDAIAARTQAKDAADVAVAAARGMETFVTDAAASANAANIRATSAEMKVDEYTPRVVALEAMNGVSPETPVDGQTANLLEQPTTLTRAAAEKATFFASPHVDARAFGLWDVADPLEDVSAILNAAADEARAKKRPLYIPAPKNQNMSSYAIHAHVNLRMIDVYCDANIIVHHTDAIGVTVGDSSGVRASRKIQMKSITNLGAGLGIPDTPYPTLRVIGLKNGSVDVYNVSFMELYANDATAWDDSIAYSTFRLQRVSALHIQGVGGGWINENSFYCGSLERIRFAGEYSHNGNMFYNPSLEGKNSIVDFQTGIMNQILNARTEGGTKVFFAPRARRNILESSHLRNPGMFTSEWVVEGDHEGENIITSKMASFHDVYTLAQFTPESIVANRATGIADTLSPTASGIKPALPGGKIRLPIYGNWLDTGIIPLEIPNGGGWGESDTQRPRSRITRFNLCASSRALRPEVTLYDQDRQVIPPTASVMDNWGGWRYGEQNAYFGASVTSAVVAILDPNVKYIRIAVHSNDGENPSENRLVDHVTLSAYLPIPHSAGIITKMRNLISRPLWSTNAPTQGVAWPGTVIQGPGMQWVSVARTGTTLTAAPSTTEIQVDSATDIQVGDVIGVELPTGETHWSKVGAVAGTTLTLTTALPTAANPAAQVGTTRWREVAAPV